MPEQTGRPILVVDPDPRSLRILEVSLGKAGFRVLAAGDGAAALALIDAEKPELVITDTQLPEVDGFDLCQRIKLRPDGAAIQVVFLSAQTGRQDRLRALELGAEDFIVRPAYTNEIVARVRMLLHRRERSAIAGSDVPPRMAGELADISVVDLVQMIEAVQRSGVIQISDREKRRGGIYFRQGRVVDAEVGRLAGADALYRLLSWTDGQFEIEWKTVRRNDVVQLPTSSLLLEGMRRLDEWTRLLVALPPLKTVFEVDYRALADRLAEIPDEANGVLRLFDGRRTFLQVIDDCAFADLEAISIIGRLFADGIIHDAATRPADSGSIAVPTPGWFTESSGRLVPADVFDPPAAAPLRAVQPGTFAREGAVAKQDAQPKPGETAPEQQDSQAQAETVTAGHAVVTAEASARDQGPAPLPRVDAAREEPTPVVSPEPEPGDKVAALMASAKAAVVAAADSVAAAAVSKVADDRVAATATASSSLSDRATPVRLVIDLPVATPPLGMPVEAPLPRAKEDSAVPRPRSEDTGNVMRFPPRAGGVAEPRSAKHTQPLAIVGDDEGGVRSVKQTTMGRPLEYSSLQDGSPRQALPRTTPMQGSPVVRPVITLRPKRSAANTTHPGLGATPLQEPQPPVEASASDQLPAATLDQHAATPSAQEQRSPQDLPASGDIEAAPMHDVAPRPGSAESTVIVNEDGAYTLPFNDDDDEPAQPDEDLATVEARHRRHRRSLVLGVVGVAAAGAALGVWLMRPSGAPTVTDQGMEAVATPGAGAVAGSTLVGAPHEPMPPVAPPVAVPFGPGAPGVVAGAPPVPAVSDSHLAQPAAALPPPAPSAPPAPAAAALPPTTLQGAPAPVQPVADLVTPCEQAVAAERVRAADRACSALIQADPENVRAMSLAAQSALLSGRYKQALRWARQSTQRDPAQAEAWAVIGIVEQQNNNREAARAAYGRYLELAPTGKLAKDIRSSLENL